MDKLLDYLHWDIEVRRGHMIDREPPAVRVTEIEEGKILDRDGMQISAFLVEHDPVKPAYGYRFDGEGRSLVDLRRHAALREPHEVEPRRGRRSSTSAARWRGPRGRRAAAGRRVEEKIRDLASYHTQPDEIGRVAEGARPKRLVMTHLMPGSDPAELKGAAEKYFRGPVVVGDDLLEV